MNKNHMGIPTAKQTDVWFKPFVRCRLQNILCIRCLAEIFTYISNNRSFVRNQARSFRCSTRYISTLVSNVDNHISHERNWITRVTLATSYIIYLIIRQPYINIWYLKLLRDYWVKIDVHYAQTQVKLQNIFNICFETVGFNACIFSSIIIINIHW